MTGARTLAAIPTRDPQSGLSLVEVLVTLAIVGVMAGLLTLGAGRIAAPDLARTEAQRLARVLDTLADAALVSGTERVVSLASDGYRVDGLDPRRLPPGVTLARTDRAVPSIRLSGYGDAPPAILQVSDGAAVWVVSFDGLRAQAAPDPSGKPRVRP
ncbi:MAG: prepilin-type N-terminal cleavage/methylation domain-containing protein [Rhodobacteraceae bacterium]|jgi:general secretion pathway protein H|nr:prepilin-type N-terminal cleavage/methylation domain-containing protein [Paracoccaceae bacterium]